ncbi:MAG: LysE family transporter, partial [Candidatus Aquicultorales bacterium]
LSGIATSLANPYWSLWWAAIGALILKDVLKTSGLGGLGSFYLGHIAGDFAWYGLVGVAVAGGRRVLSDSVYRGVLMVCGVFLTALAGAFILGIPIFDLLKW